MSQDSAEFTEDPDDSLDIAVIGMAGRFPGARNVEEFWRNIKSGTCSARHITDEELAARGVDAAVRQDPDFVPVSYPMEGSEEFDAAFFGYSPREAEILDPQQRVLLECAWSAVESAGYAPGRYEGPVGVYAGAGNNTYLLFHVATQPDSAQILKDKQTVLGNRSDFLSSRVSYKLGLEGPSVNIQSACSTSLVAVVEACQSLLSYQCDMALAGGVAVDSTRHDGYLYRQDGILSPDGYCRTFDARAQGTVGGDGVGMVVLKRLEDALSDRDHIHAVIKSSALNNDGARRAGFSAPNAVTQSSAITMALDNSGLPAESIRHVELHGTATVLGDPIEFTALKSAFSGVEPHRCALGSVKTNIGHLDSAAGIAGLIKTVLMVENGQIPPSLHFEEPNPRLGIDGSPFYVNTELRDWPEDGTPRRAGVSSFGLGGTNAHVIVEQPPRPSRSPGGGGGTRTEQLLVLSAKSPAALDDATEQLHDHLRTHPEVSLRDVAFTLQHGRTALAYRRMLVCSDREEALDILESRDDGRLLSSLAPEAAQRTVAFVFTGFGSQFPGMSHGLYEEEPVFREAVDRCAELLEPMLGRDLRELVFAAGEKRGTAAPLDFSRLLEQPERSDHPLDQPLLGYPAVFMLEFALVELWASWGVSPEGMIGHSLGEYVAACAAGVFSLEDALRLVVERARLIEEQEEGAMLAVPLPEEEALRHTSDTVSLAAVNSSRSCVLSGTVEGIERVAEVLQEAGTPGRRLNSSFAFHSPMMDPVLQRYEALVRSVRLSPPSLPFVSNLTGTWITDDEAVDPGYWARHVRRTVRFSDGVGTLWNIPDITMVEIGPAPTLMTDVIQHKAAVPTDRVVVASLPSALAKASDRSSMLGSAGRLWLAGRNRPFPDDGTGRRLPLPTYPFERQRYWLEPGADHSRTGTAGERVSSSSDWFYTPSWRRLSVPPQVSPSDLASRNWLVFADEHGVGHALAERLTHLGAVVRTVSTGDRWSAEHKGGYVVDPARPDHFVELARALRAEGLSPDRVVHCWGVGSDADGPSSAEETRALLHRSFTSLVGWAQATGAELMTDPRRWDLISSGVHSVLGNEALCPPKATVQGLSRVLVQEYPSLTCAHVDLCSDGLTVTPALVERLLGHLSSTGPESTVALRGGYYWTPTLEAGTLPPRAGTAARPEGVYLITGGLGKIGLLMARALAEQAPVRLVLLGRKGLPERAKWDDPGLPEAVRGAIRAVREVEALGSTVLVVSADVSDAARMREVKEEILRDLGSIDGVLHCAGTTGQDAHRSVSELTEEESSWHFGPKLYGAEVLREILSDQRLDFAIICSSIASLLGGLGFGAYAAANAALDSFAECHHTPEQPWTSVNWEAWHFQEEDHGRTQLGAAVRELALTPAEGREVFEKLLQSSPQPQVAVSTGDLGLRQELWASPVKDAPAPARRHERPHLRNPYVAPSGLTEHRVAEIWQELLGVEKVGVHDNFFELGGSSLLGLQVVHRLRQEMAIAVPLTIVYEGPTVRTLGSLIESLEEDR